jgi:hypothetical protein
VNDLRIISVSRLLESIVTAANSLLNASLVEKMYNSAELFRLSWGLLRYTQTGLKSLNRCATIVRELLKPASLNPWQPKNVTRQQ